MMAYSAFAGGEAPVPDDIVALVHLLRLIFFFLRQGNVPREEGRIS